MANINDSYFDGYYKDIWRTLIPAELTVKEVDFMMDYFQLNAGDHIVDLMCGYGRHALALAEKGITVTAVDNLPDYIHELTAKAEAAQLPVTASCEGILSFQPPAPADLIICMGNSFNFFDRGDASQLLQMISDHLKPDGHFLINSWSLAEIAFHKPVPRSWSRVGDLIFLGESKILFHPTRLETETTIIHPSGNNEVKTAIDYLYSINETEQMLQQAGLVLDVIFSIPGKKQFSVGEPRAYIIASKAS